MLLVNDIPDVFYFNSILDIVRQHAAFKMRTLLTSVTDIWPTPLL